MAGAPSLALLPVPRAGIHDRREPFTSLLGAGRLALSVPYLSACRRPYSGRRRPLQVSAEPYRPLAAAAVRAGRRPSWVFTSARG